MPAGPAAPLTMGASTEEGASGCPPSAGPGQGRTRQQFRPPLPRLSTVLRPRPAARSPTGGRFAFFPLAPASTRTAWQTKGCRTPDPVRPPRDGGKSNHAAPSGAQGLQGSALGLLSPLSSCRPALGPWPLPRASPVWLGGLAWSRHARLLCVRIKGFSGAGTSQADAGQGHARPDGRGLRRGPHECATRTCLSAFLWSSRVCAPAWNCCSYIAGTFEDPQPVFHGGCIPHLRGARST